MLAHWSLSFSEMLNQHSFTAVGRAVVGNKTSFMLVFMVYLLFLNVDRKWCWASENCKYNNKDTKTVLPKELPRRTKHVKSWVV